jgi:hypothetical protein
MRKDGLIPVCIDARIPLRSDAPHDRARMS